MSDYNCSWQMYGGRYFSQHGEDLVALNVFRHIWIDKPSYLDLGAHHPIHISNTHLFYVNGSRGINVEANPELIHPFLELRPEDINLNVGVGLKNEQAPFYVYDNASGRNSFIRKIAEEHGDVVAVNIPVMTINDIVQKHARGVFPDYLSIDIEGMDLAVLTSIEYERSSPKVICVEMFSGLHGQWDDTNEIVRFLKDKYFLYFRSGANGTFVRNEYRKHLIE